MVARVVWFGWVLAALMAPLDAADNPPPRPPTDEEIRQQLVAEIERVRAARERQNTIADARRKLQDKDFEGAAALLAQVIEIQPEAALYLDLGQAQIGLTQFGRARESFLQALNLDANLISAKRGLGWLAFRNQDYAAALRWWAPLLQAGQRDGELLERAGQCYYFLHQRQAALECFNAAALGRPADDDLDRWRIFSAQDAGEFALADRLARAHLARQADDLPVRRIAARSAAALQRREDAILQLERLNLDGHMTAEDWRLLSDLYALQDDPARAADCLAAHLAARLEPTGPETTPATAADWLQLGQLQEQAGRLSDAAVTYAKVAVDTAESATAQLGLARIARQQYDPAAALRHCAAALKKRADLAEAHLLSGWAHEQLNEPGPAAEDYRQAGATPRLAAEAQLGLARLAYLDNQLSAALRHYQAAADLRPADRGLQQIIRQLEAHLAAAEQP